MWIALIVIALFAILTFGICLFYSNPNLLLLLEHCNYKLTTFLQHLTPAAATAAAVAADPTTLTSSALQYLGITTSQNLELDCADGTYIFDTLKLS